jgi:hypothetical protein
MLKGIVVTVISTLLVSSIALGDAAQIQGFSISGQNGAAVSGDGAAANSNVSNVNTSQLATDAINHNSAFQSTAGSLIQSAGAIGMGGLFSAGQLGGAAGTQLQGLNLGIQLQDLDAGLYQEVDKVGGNGSALGLQTFIGIQTQLNFTPYGGSANIQGIGTTLYDAVGGGPSSTIAIGGGSNIGVGQSSLQ